jgi:predicted Ser/Thr protein kinase
MTPEIATPSVYPKARKKLYMALVKGRSLLEAEAYAAKPCVLKSMPRPIPAIRERKIQEGILVN